MTTTRERLARRTAPHVAGRLVACVGVATPGPLLRAVRKAVTAAAQRLTKGSSAPRRPGDGSRAVVPGPAVVGPVRARRATFAAV